MIDFPDEEFAAEGVRGPLRLEDVLLAAAKANRVAPLQVLRADRVVGGRHLQSAAFHASRALKEGRSHADRIEVEFTRYASGERQIRKAIDKLGVPDDCPAAAVCSFGPKRADAIAYFVDFLGLPVDDSVLDATDDSLKAFGITAAQLGATSPAARFDLALEAVAAVNLMRK